MAGLVPAIHALPRGTKNVDARDKPGHDDRPYGAIALLHHHRQFLMSMALRRPSESRLKQIETAKIIAPGRAATQGLT